MTVALVTGLSGVICLLYGSLATWAAMTKLWTPVYETLPREITGPVLIIPLATTVSTSMLTVGIAVGTLTLGNDPVVAVGLRPHMGVLTLVGLAVGLVAPWAALRFIRLEREGLDVAIFDLQSPPRLVLNALQRRWTQLHDERRLCYRRIRVEGLGDLEAASENPWPSGHRLGTWTRPRTLIFVLFILACASVAFIAIDAFTGSVALNRIAIGSFIIFPGALTVLAFVLVAYTVTAQEQRNAELLRRAYSAAHERLDSEKMAHQQAPSDMTKKMGDNAAGCVALPAGASVAVLDVEAAVSGRIERMSRLQLLVHATSKGRSWR